MVTDKLILEKLPKKEARELLDLNKKYYPLLFDLIQSQEKMLKDQKNPAQFGGSFLKKVKECLRIHILYRKVTDDEIEYMNHWKTSKFLHGERTHEYKHNKKPERKDNKTSINRGSGFSNKNEIRYPSKKRKTAWKRFYRLFPGLKPKEEDLNEPLTNNS